MQSSFMKISPTVRIIISLILIFTLIISKSIFLNLFLTTLVLIIIILSNISIKTYLKGIRLFIPWLMYSILIYIVIYRNTIGTLLFTYKLLLITLVIETLVISSNFSDLNKGIYTLLYPLSKLGINVDRISSRFSLYIYYLKYFNDSSNIIKKSQVLNNKVKYDVNSYIMPRLIISNKYINDLKTYLRVNFYESKKDKLDSKSIIYLTSFVILFFLVIFKEVIL